MKTEKREPQPTNDLVAQYRPLGLKAVLAAALQHKATPGAKKLKQPAEVIQRNSAVRHT